MIHLSPTWNDINKINSETKNICERVVDELEKQGELLKNSNEKLNKSKIVLDNSNKITKSMTWYGWFINLIPFSSFFSNIVNIINGKRKKENIFIENDDLSNPNIKLEQNNYNDYKNMDELKQLEKDLTDLKDIGEKIGWQLDSHNYYIDKMNEKSQLLILDTKKTIKKNEQFL